MNDPNDIKNFKTTEGAGDDVVAMEIAVKMAELMFPCPFFMILGFLKHFLDFGDELAGFAAYALEPMNINPKDALNPALAFMVATPEFKKLRPELRSELRRRGVDGTNKRRPAMAGRRRLSPF